VLKNNHHNFSFKALNVASAPQKLNTKSIHNSKDNFAENCTYHFILVALHMLLLQILESENSPFYYLCLLLHPDFAESLSAAAMAPLFICVDIK
jgi:hypothetical protein